MSVRLLWVLARSSVALSSSKDWVLGACPRGDYCIGAEYQWPGVGPHPLVPAQAARRRPGHADRLSPQPNHRDRPPPDHPRTKRSNRCRQAINRRLIAKLQGRTRHEEPGQELPDEHSTEAPGVACVVSVAMGEITAARLAVRADWAADVRFAPICDPREVGER